MSVTLSNCVHHKTNRWTFKGGLLKYDTEIVAQNRMDEFDIAPKDNHFPQDEADYNHLKIRLCPSTLYPRPTAWKGVGVWFASHLGDGTFRI